MTLGADGHVRRVDMHLHSTCSDGTVSPTEVAERASRAGLAAFALTDHDTTAGLDEAESAAERLGLRFIPGAELSATVPGASVHLLAFGFDRSNASLQRFLGRYDVDRRQRARSIVDCLRETGLDISYSDVESEAGSAAPTRAHVARAMIAGAHVEAVGEAFHRYLSRGRPAFVDKRDVAPRDVFDVVHDAGGVVLLAHPGRVHGPDAIKELVDQGLDGVEVMHPANRATTRSTLNALAVELGLLRSGGSDWHGPETHRKAGIGAEPVPERWFDEILERASALTG